MAARPRRISSSEFLVDEVLQFGDVGGRFDQGEGSVPMAAAQAGTDGQGTGAVAGCGSSCGAQQLVGNLGHGADNNYRALALRDSTGNDGRSAIDGSRVLDRSAAKLHDYQAHA
jgi:hypothetical protein